MVIELRCDWTATCHNRVLGDLPSRVSQLRGWKFSKVGATAPPWKPKEPKGKESSKKLTLVQSIPVLSIIDYIQFPSEIWHHGARGLKMHVHNYTKYETKQVTLFAWGSVLFDMGEKGLLSPSFKSGKITPMSLLQTAVIHHRMPIYLHLAGSLQTLSSRVYHMFPHVSTCSHIVPYFNGRPPTRKH